MTDLQSPASPRRRALLGAAGALVLAPGLARLARAASPAPFSFDTLVERARQLAGAPFRPPPRPGAAVLEGIDFDAYQRIRFRPEYALFAEPGRAGCTVQLFHPGRFFKEPVGIHQIRAGRAETVPFSSRMFDYQDPTLARALAPGTGFAGFRVMNPGAPTDWLAYLGAAYFRGSGPDGQYGQSARAIAVNTAMPYPEEFPRFTDFFIEMNDPAGCTVTVHALLDGPSVAGAVRMVCRRADPVTQDVTVRLFLRRDIERLGIAPLTSMYWYGERDRRPGADWRPEIHDTDGLSLWTGTGERLWRPLANPGTVRTSAFADPGVRGFGLLQRDREFDHYQDDGAWYDRRPGAWVEPLGDWGPGAVELVEIPTDGEVEDNIVALWRPRAPARAGDALAFDYRLHWVRDEPYPPGTARVVHTFSGRTGRPGHPAADRPGRKYVIDFAGPALEPLAQRFDVSAVVSASRGEVSGAYALKVVGTRRWRALFDLHADGAEPVDLRCFLRLGDQTLTETWVYIHLPGTPA